MVRSNLKEAYKTNSNGEVILSDADIDSEIVAMFSENRIFTDKNTVDDIARLNLGVAEKIYNWVKEKVYSFIPGSREKAMLLKAERLYRKAIDEANKIQLTEKTFYKLTDEYIDSLKKVKKSKRWDETFAIYNKKIKVMEQIPDFYVKRLGFEKLPVYINANHVKKALGLKDKKGESHNVGYAQMLNIEKILDSPKLIFIMNDKYHILSKEKDLSSPPNNILISIKRNDVVRGDRSVKAHNILTIFGKKPYESWLDDKKIKIIYPPHIKKEDLKHYLGRNQSPTEGHLNPVDSIYYNNDKSNNKFSLELDLNKLDTSKQLKDIVAGYNSLNRSTAEQLKSLAPGEYRDGKLINDYLDLATREVIKDNKMSEKTKEDIIDTIARNNTSRINDSYDYDTLVNYIGKKV